MARKKPIISPLGQWAYPGEVTIIPSSKITMKGVNYPVLGVDDLGNQQMMMPGGEYDFPGNYVTEYPQMQFGGMSKRKVDKILNKNKDLNFVQRMYQPNTPSIMIPGQQYPATHFMESGDGRAYPTVVQMPDGTLQYLGDNAYDYANQTGQYIEFPNDRQARRFAKNYKKGTGVLEKFGKGGWLNKYQTGAQVPFSDSANYSYDKDGNLIYTNYPFGFTYNGGINLFINDRLNHGTEKPLNNYEIDFLENAKNKIENLDIYPQHFDFQVSTQVDKLNPSLEELIKVTQNTYPDQYAIDNSFSKTSRSDSKINLPPSAFENDIKERYLIPDVLKNSINKSFGILPTTQEEGYSPNRIWTTKVKDNERSGVGAAFTKPGDYAYILTPNSKKTLGFSKEKINTKKENIENSLSSIDNKFYEDVYEKYPDYIQYPGNYNNPEISLFGNIKNRLPNQMWNRAEQMRVEMLNNPDIKDWADLHNLNLSKQTKDSKQNLVIDDFAPKVPESVYANRLVKAGLPVSTPDYNYGHNDTYIVQDPSKFNLAGYFPIPEGYSDENAQELIAKKLGIKQEQLNSKDYLIHYNKTPITEYTPGKKYGGWLEEYQVGGTLPPRYTSDINDPRLASYNDSLNLYKSAKNDFNKFNKLSNNFDRDLNDEEWQRNSDRYDKLLNLQKNKWHTAEYFNDTYRPNYTANYPYKGPKSGLTIQPVGLEGFYREGYHFPRFKKPVQPYIYKPEVVPEVTETPLPVAPIEQPVKKIGYNKPIIQQFNYMSNENKAKALQKYGSVGDIPFQGVDINQLKDGGWLDEFQVGGVRAPIYTSDLSKVRSYRDSLNLYNSGEDYYRRLKKSSFDSPNIGVSEEDLKKARDENDKKYPWDKLKMPVSNEKSGKKFQPVSKYNIYVSDVGNIESNRYKKPVQPYIYKKSEVVPEVVETPVAPAPVIEPPKPSLFVSNIDRDMYTPNGGMAREYNIGVTLQDGNRKSFRTEKEYQDWKAANNLDISKAKVTEGRGYSYDYPENKKYGGWLSKYQTAGEVDIVSTLKELDPNFNKPKNTANPLLKEALASADKATDMLQLGHFSTLPWAQAAGLVGDVAGISVDLAQSGIANYEGNNVNAVGNLAMASVPLLGNSLGYERSRSLISGTSPGNYRPLSPLTPAHAANPVIAKGLGWNKALLAANIAEIASNTDSRNYTTQRVPQRDNAQVQFRPNPNRPRMAEGGWLNKYQTAGEWAGWTPNVGKPYMRTNPAGNAGYSDNTRVVTQNTNVTPANIKAAEAGEYARKVGTISQGTRKSDYEKAREASSFVSQAERRKGSADPLDYVLDIFNPAAIGFAGIDLVDNTGSAVSNTMQGKFSEAGSDLLGAGLNALNVIPAAAELRGPLRSAGKYLTTNTALKNTYKYNPLAFKPNPEAYYRGIGRSGVDDALEKGILRSPVNTPFGKDRLYMTETLGETNMYNKDLPTYKGDPFGGANDKWIEILPKDGKGYIAEIPKNKTNFVIDNDVFNTGSGYSTIFPKLSDVKLYQQDWLKGYKEIKKQYGVDNIATPNISQSTSIPPVSWQAQELPGLHLKSTMTDGPISKIVEPKTGLVNVEQALGIIGKESGGVDKVALIKQGLGENIPKKMDYNDFRKTVQDQLIPLEKQFSTERSDYGLDSLLGLQFSKRSSFEDAIKFANIEKNKQLNIIKEYEGYLKNPKKYKKAFPYEQTINKSDNELIPDIQSTLNNYKNGLAETEKQIFKNMEDMKKLPLENQTLILGNKGKFGSGSSAHGNPEETLGHAHFLRDAETPDVLTVTQIQSDAFQGTHRRMPKGKLTKTNDSIDNDYIDEAGRYFDTATGENFTQKSLLDKNHQERYLQELVNYAGERGDINKMRVPTSETAAKVQAYKKQEQIISETYIPSKDDIPFEQWSDYDKEPSIMNRPETLAKYRKGNYDIKKESYYMPEQQTILKKYAEQPTTIKKLFGEEPTIVTDSKGNTWYEFDIPKKFKEGKGEIKAFSTIGGIGVAGAAASQLPEQKYGGWLNKYQVGGAENPTEWDPEIERMQGVDIHKKLSWPEKLRGYVHQFEKKIGLDPYNERSDDFMEQWARRINDATGGRDWYKQPNDGSGSGIGTAMMETIMAPFSAPQYAALYGLTGKVQRPSEALNIKNPVGAFLTDVALDPVTYIAPTLRTGQRILNATEKAIPQAVSYASKLAQSQIIKNPKLALSLQRGRPTNLDNVNSISGIRYGDVSSVANFNKLKPNNISEHAFFRKLEKGTASLDNSINKRVADLESEEGFRRLVEQEKAYLFDNTDTDLSVIDRIAKLNAKARIEELKNVKNVNKEATEYANTNFLGTGRPNPFVDDSYLYNNAYHRPASLYDQFVKSSGTLNLKKPTPNYSKSVPGEIGMGYNYVGNVPTEMHEIGHALQRGRILSLDNGLKNIIPKKQLKPIDQKSYKYFKKGSSGSEPTAFANELREAMFQKGFIPDYYTPINQKQIQDAYKYFKKNPMGVYDKNTGSFASSTRIFDFMEPNKANSKLLTDVLNRLPAVAPLGIGAATASQLQEQKKGGQTNWLNKYK